MSLLKEANGRASRMSVLLVSTAERNSGSPTVAAGAILNGGAVTKVVSSASNRCSGV